MKRSVNSHQYLALALAAAVAASTATIPLPARAQERDPDAEIPRLELPAVDMPKVVDAFRVPDASDPHVRDGAVENAGAVGRPEWVDKAVLTSREQLRDRSATIGRLDPDTDLRLLAAERDDRGETFVRLEQYHDGVKVFAGQLLAHLDPAGALRHVDQDLFDASGAETAPLVDEPTALAAAVAALGAASAAAEPAIELMLLPEAVRTGDDAAVGATLTYRVTLLASTPGRPRHFRCFVDARDGRVVYSYDDLCSAFGTARTFYNGTQTIGTQELADGKFALRNVNYANSEVRDARNLELGDDGFPADGIFVSTRNRWGNGTLANRRTLAGDAMYGLEKSWDYFRFRHGRSGADGNGTPVHTYVHYGSSVANAYGGSNYVFVGDGDGTMGPFATLDVMAHEFTHSVVEYSADLISGREPGAVNEAMSDIFAVSVDFSASSPTANYTVGEQIVAGGIRNLQAPAADHTSDMRPTAGCAPTEANDDCSVHFNSTVVSHAFFLLAEGGRHAQTGVVVTGLGRTGVENIFYRALTRHMTPNSNFFDTAVATVKAADEIHGDGSAVSKVVTTAWQAVGVFLPPSNPGGGDNDLTTWKLVLYTPNDNWGRTAQINDSFDYMTLKDYPGAFSTWTHVVGGSGYLFCYSRTDRSGAVGIVERDGTIVTVKNWPAGAFGDWTHIVHHDGSFLFYNAESGTAVISRLEGNPPELKTYNGYVGSFSTGWSHIVDVQGWLFFYNMSSGLAAIGTFDEVYGGDPGQFPTLRRIDFRQARAFHNFFSAGWSHVVDTRRGVLFYNRASGIYRVGDFDGTGAFAQREPRRAPGSQEPYWTYSQLRTGFSHVVAADDRLLFYDRETGAGMTAEIRSSETSLTWLAEPLSIRVVYGEGAISDPREMRWSHVVPVAVPGTAL